MADLQLVAVDVASFAVMRALSGNEEEIGAGQLAVLVLIRGETTDLSVVRNGSPLFARSIPLGSSTFTEVIASNMGIELEEAVRLFDKLVIPVAGDEVFDDPMAERAADEIRPLLKDLTSEIQKSIEYFHQSQQENSRIQQLVLSDRGAKLKNLDQYFSHALGIDVEVSNPLKFLSFSESQFDIATLNENATIYATAIGLARRGLEEH
jgi:type IV pilus assembly protein PilM